MEQGSYVRTDTPQYDLEAHFRAFDPVRGEPFGPEFRDASPEEVDEAVRQAELAFEPYHQLAPERRAAFLDRIAEEILALGDELIAIACRETALPAGRLTGERARTVGQLRLFADVVREGSWVEARIDTGDPEREPAPKPDLRRMLVPLGPVAVFGASNFPLAFSVAGGDTVSALAAGCPVVYKAHPAHPVTSELVAGAVRRAVAAEGMPEGVFSMLHGMGYEVGLALVRHPLIQAVGFTGSLRGGRALFDAAAARPAPIPVYAEMGSINPVFVLPSALERNGDAIAEGLTNSITMGVGQFCTNPGLVLGVQGEAWTRFIARLAERIVEVPAGTMLYKGIQEAFCSGRDRLRSIPGVRTIAESRSGAGVGAVIFTTDVGSFLDRPELSEELFGPSSLVVTATGAEELERVARRLEGQLTATIHATEEDLLRHRVLIDILQRKVGRLIFNGYPTGVEVGHAMQHGGPYPATTDARSTSVGTAAIFRFARPVCFQDFPQAVLPPELRNRNERGIWRLVNGELSQADL